MLSRADRNNNPAAVTTAVAAMGLETGKEYVDGDAFPPPSNLVTARLIGDPISLTIKLIDKIGYYTLHGIPRWTYISIPKFLWDSLDFEMKKRIVHFHYQNEGGTFLEPLFK